MGSVVGAKASYIELHQVDLFPDFLHGGKSKTGAEAFLAQCTMGKGQLFLCGFCSPLET